jgi:ABC-type antimicrobial peptide transport system permease subunit
VLTSTTDTMTYLLAGIAAVSLLVGGIGIMNIMLVSVTERTREIGLRLSVGARDIDVLTQFMVEALVLSVAGGAIGVALGFALSLAVSAVLNWSASVTPQAIALSFGVAAAVSVFFGFYPARKAARLNPIDALRYE